jgi:glutamine synthetase
MRGWPREHPEISAVRGAVSELNGQARGKRIPARGSAKNS